MPEYNKLITLINQISDYYKIEESPTVDLDGSNITVTVCCPDMAKTENIAKHLAILGFRNTYVSRETNIFVFSKLVTN